MTLHADLEKLDGMSKSLHGLGDEAAEFNALDGVPILMILPGGLGSVGSLSSVVEASNMAFGVQQTLIPAAAERLNEIGDLMHAVTVQFRNGDDADVPELVSTYTESSGDWARPR